MQTYEERRQARIDRLRERAEGARAESIRLVKAGDEALDRIPFGQPILIGHHSERGDRAYRGRAISKIDRGIAMERRADELERRADAAEANRAISADDPNAPDRLREKIARLERTQDVMKSANRIIQGKPKNERTDEKIAALEALGLPNPGRLFVPDFCGRIGFPSYALQNNGANIRRLRERVTEIEATAAVETTETEYDGFTIRENAELNRVQILFPGKPDEATRALLKSMGFRWAPSEGAWQRQLNANGRYAAKIVAERLTA